MVQYLVIFEVFELIYLRVYLVLLVLMLLMRSYHMFYVDAYYSLTVMPVIYTCIIGMLSHANKQKFS